MNAFMSFLKKTFGPHGCNLKGTGSFPSLTHRHCVGADILNQRRTSGPVISASSSENVVKMDLSVGSPMLTPNEMVHAIIHNLTGIT